MMGEPLSMSWMPLMVLLWIRVWMASAERWPRQQWSEWMSTCLIVLALEATCACSTLYRPFELAGMLPMTLPDLFSKVTVLPVLVMWPMETIVSIISGTWRVLWRRTRVVVVPLGMLI